jgi:predicted transcriptional regulator
MVHNTQIREHIVNYVLVSLLLSGILIGIIAAYPLSPQMSINKIQIKDSTEDTELVIGDGKDIIIDVEGADVLLFWRQMFISHLSAFAQLRDLILVVAPFLDTLLKYFCVAHFQSTKQRRGSIVPQRILVYVQENPGCSQKQLITELMVSRGSICYHLHKLRSTGKLMQISRNGTTL